MASKISQRPPATYLGRSDQLPIVQGGSTKRIPASSLMYYVDAREFGMVGDGATDNASALTTAESQLASNNVLMFPVGSFLFTAGMSTKKRIGIIGCGSATRMLWRPAVSNSTLFTWTNASAATIDLNEEGQLDSFPVSGFRIIGNRVARANAMLFNRVDWVELERVMVYGVRGYSLRLSNSREFFIDGFRTRYNAHFDSTNPELSVPDIILDSPNGAVDTTNWVQMSNVFVAYPMGEAIELDNADQISIATLKVHLVPQANAALETNFVAAFGGSGGFTSNVADNDYAALHTYSTGNEATVSGLTLSRAYKSVGQAIRAVGSQGVRIGIGRIQGGLTHRLVWADAASEVSITNMGLTSADAGTTVSGVATADAGTDVVTVATVDFPPTGEPVRFTTTTTLPAPLVVGTTYYAINTGATTGKLATTRALAEAGTAIDITTTGTGTHTLHAIRGYILVSTGGSKIAVDQTVELNDARHAHYHDATSGSAVFGVPLLGGTWSDIATQTQPFVVGPSLAAGPGVQIQDTTGRKLGMHSVPPSIQRASASQAAVPGTGATNDQLATLLNEVRAALVEKGLIKGSA